MNEHYTYLVENEIRPEGYEWRFRGYRYWSAGFGCGEVISRKDFEECEYRYPTPRHLLIAEIAAALDEVTDLTVEIEALGRDNSCLIDDLDSLREEIVTLQDAIARELRLREFLLTVVAELVNLRSKED